MVRQLPEIILSIWRKDCTHFIRVCSRFSPNYLQGSDRTSGHCLVSYYPANRLGFRSSQPESSVKDNSSEFTIYMIMHAPPSDTDWAFKVFGAIGITSSRSSTAFRLRTRQSWRSLRRLGYSMC